MIKFFRKIRHKLVSENKFSQYLIYAIGEITLVVIGILIALSINNWNQERSERRMEQAYIQSLIEDAKTDLVNLDQALILNNKRTEILDSLEQLCYNYGTEGITDPAFMAQFILSIKFPDFIKQTDRTLSQLKNSGGMRLIKDETKINAIIKYEESFKRLYNQQVWYEGGLNDLVNAGVLVFNFKYLPGHTRNIEKETFYKTTRLFRADEELIIELGNRATVYNALTFAYISFLENCKQECHKFVDILENKNPTFLER